MFGRSLPVCPPKKKRKKGKLENPKYDVRKTKVTAVQNDDNSCERYIVRKGVHSLSKEKH